MKKISSALLAALALAVAVSAPAQTLSPRYLAAVVTGTGVQPAVRTEPPYPGYASTDPIQHQKTFVATSTGGTATVNVEASQDGATWFVLATFSLVAATPQQTLSNAAWAYYRANITASAGTVTVTMYP